MEVYAEAGGFDLFKISSIQQDKQLPGIYCSAGIHGDEPAGTEALIEWAEANPDCLRSGFFLIFPCLNPWGLVNNCRCDAKGRDLNRTYDAVRFPQTSAHRKAIGEHKFDLAITLHEDYDANGFYLYEIRGPQPYWGEDLLAAAAQHLPLDSRKTIDGRAATHGLVRRRISTSMMIGHPEAFLLHFHHSKRVFTLESPSEYFLDDRISAHIAVLKCAITRCLLRQP
jgi:protein MpaA